MQNLNKYKSKEEAINEHKSKYRSYGGIKGKYLPNAPDELRINKLIEPIQKRPDTFTILDIGCNDGSFADILQKNGYVVYAIDVVKELVEYTKLKGIFAQIANAENLPFTDKKFDCVVMAEVLEHLYKPEDAIKEIDRVLKNDGLFVGSVPHVNGILGLNKKADYHNWVFAEEDLITMFLPYFKSIEITETPYSKYFCEQNNINPELKQWYNWICKK